MNEAKSIVIPSKWIKIVEGKFICIECGNEIGGEENLMETSTPDGIIRANLEEIKTQLKEFPSKIIYAICSVCGMEYTFKFINDELYLDESEMQK